MTGTDAAWLRLPTWAALPFALRMFRGSNLLQMVPALGGLSAAVATVDGLSLVVVGLGALALLVVLAAYALAWQRRFRYRIDEDGIAVQSGVAHRSELELSWERVRNVDVRQPFYFRPLDRVALIVESSGGKDEEVAIQAVRRDVAERVRESIVSYQRTQVPSVPGGSPSTGPATPGCDGDEAEATAATHTTDRGHGDDRDAATLHHPSTSELLLHGAINGRAFGLLVAALGTVYTAFQPVIMEADAVSGAVEQVLRWGWRALLLALPGLIAVSVVLVAVSALIALVRFYDFRLLRDRDRFRIRHGLLETRERTLRTSKLQALTVVETAVGRRLGRCHLLAHQASSATPQSSSDADGTAEIPALRTAGAPAVMALFDAAYGDRPPLERIDPAFRRFWAVRLAGPLTVLPVAALVAVLVWDTPSTALIVAASLLIVAVPAATVALVHARWRHWGWTVTADVVHVASGLLGRRHEAVRIDRVQQVTVPRTPFQRRFGLASIALSLADSDRRIPFLPHDEAVGLANRVLHTVETRPHLDL